ncbi:plasmid pRiA4b ORF-3 family protein [Paraburkholderia sp. Cy-641]|nr:plasmid pRiA4b ORF-3 family protein [Paraburkholderia sp. Cy-641]
MRISLRDVGPPIWCRVLIPEQITIAQLDQIMQFAMGWDNEHLHRSSFADGVMVAIATVRFSSSVAQMPFHWRRLACTNMGALPTCTTSSRHGFMTCASSGARATSGQGRYLLRRAFRALPARRRRRPREIHERTGSSWRARIFQVDRDVAWGPD